MGFGKVVENIAQVVRHMRKAGFKRFMVAEPPVSIHMPIIYWAGKLLPGTGRECPDILQRGALDGYAKLRELNNTSGIEIEVFGEIEVVMKTGTYDDYIDMIHPSQMIHDTLAAEAAKT